MSDFPSTEHWWIALGEMAIFFRYFGCIMFLFVGFKYMNHSASFQYSHLRPRLGSGLVMMIFGGQILAYKLFRSNFISPTELQNF